MVEIILEDLYMIPNEEIMEKVSDSSESELEILENNTKVEKKSN